MTKKPEKESVTVTDVTGTNGQQFKKVVMIISTGKLSAIQSSLNMREDHPVAHDLLQMINRATYGK
jgi:hypothetical protein